MRYVRTAPPAVAPISLDDVRKQIRIDFGDDDIYLTSLIDAAVQYLDGRSGALGRALINQTWRLETNAVSGICYGADWIGGGWLGEYGRIYLDLPPVSAITGIGYYTGGILTTWSSSGYRLGYDGSRAFVTTIPGGSWPSADYNREDAWQITFTAGYGTLPTDVPMPIRQALLLLVSHWHSNREVIEMTSGRSLVLPLPFSVDALLAPYKGWL
jgi:uncharacterized phiE125 gp8 family phage protein